MDAPSGAATMNRMPWTTSARRVVFPLHAEVDRHTLKGALRDAGVDVSQFVDVLR
jgi:hypothetical protein